jgi:sugar O-acyltransferase (sialic acid O-acetyltransferase NeuD family)
MSNTPTPLVFLGATAVREIIEIVRDMNEDRETFTVEAVLDDNAELHGASVEGVPVVGPLEMCRDYPDARFVLGIGSYKNRLVRWKILQRLGLAAERYATLIHPGAKIYRTATIGPGTIVFPGVVIFCDTVVEECVHVLANTVIGVENRVCQGALVTSMVSTAAGVTLGHFSHIGTGAVIGDGVTVEAGAQVGMGSTVVRDVPVGAFVIGTPARRVRSDEVPDGIVAMWNDYLEHGPTG